MTISIERLNIGTSNETEFTELFGILVKSTPVSLVIAIILSNNTDLKISSLFRYFTNNVLHKYFQDAHSLGDFKLFIKKVTMIE